MKTKTRTRIELIILVIIALAGFVFASKLDADYRREIGLRDTDCFRMVEIDDMPVLIPCD